MVVVSPPVAGPAVVFTVAAVVGTAAQVPDKLGWFVCAVVVPAPNPSALSILNPHVLFTRVTGAAVVPALEAIVLELGPTSVAELVAICRLYPFDLFVVTVTTSEALEAEPPETGVMFRFTTGVLFVIEIAEPTTALIVAVSVTAYDTLGTATSPTTAKTPAPTASEDLNRLFIFILFLFLLVYMREVSHKAYGVVKQNFENIFRLFAGWSIR